VRVLLDECLPRRLKRELPGHDVRTAPEMGWASKRNGELLQLAQREFDVFLTVDRNLQHQQNLASFEIAVVVLVASSNRFDDLRPLMNTVRDSLSIAKRGEALVIEDVKS
jgi:predicted nuclease of predicted toxin-antitoxin system